MIKSFNNIIKKSWFWWLFILIFVIWVLNTGHFYLLISLISFPFGVAIGLLGFRLKKVFPSAHFWAHVLGGFVMVGFIGMIWLITDFQSARDAMPFYINTFMSIFWYNGGITYQMALCRTPNVIKAFSLKDLANEKSPTQYSKRNGENDRKT